MFVSTSASDTNIGGAYALEWDRTADPQFSGSARLTFSNAATTVSPQWSAWVGGSAPLLPSQLHGIAAKFSMKTTGWWGWQSVENIALH